MEEQAMSVTFYPAQYVSGPQWGSVLDCVDVGEDIPVNLANANALRVLEALGFALGCAGVICDLVGESDPRAFLGCVLLTQGLAPYDEEMPAYQIPGDGATVWQGARHAGYMQEKLRLLEELAAFCAAQGYIVAWA